MTPLGFHASGKRTSPFGSSFIFANGHRILDRWNHMHLLALFLKLPLLKNQDQEES
jgi:hypothetical protein